MSSYLFIVSTTNRFLYRRLLSLALSFAIIGINTYPKDLDRALDIINDAPKWDNNQQLIFDTSFIGSESI